MTAPMPPGEWMDRGACRTALHPDAWVDLPTTLTVVNLQAQDICRRACPVRQQCDAWYSSLDPTDRKGVIAGGRVYRNDGWAVDANDSDKPCARKRCRQPRRPDSETCSGKCAQTLAHDREVARERWRRIAQERAA